MEHVARVAAVLAAVVMLGLGLDLRPADFAPVFRRPRALAVGLANQFVLLPAVALLLCLAWPMPGPLVVGFMVIAACPGSAPSNLMTQLAGGDRALSVALTGITSAACFLTIPAAIALATAASETAAPGTPGGSGGAMAGALAGHAWKILLVCGLPLALGMWVRARRPTVARALARVVPPFCLAAVVGVIGATLWLQWDEVAAALVAVGAAAVVLNLLTVSLSFALATLAGAGPGSRVALCLECGLHNAALGVYVGVTLLGGGAAVMPTLAYGLLMWPTAGLVVLAARRSARREPAGAGVRRVVRRVPG